MTGLFLCCLGLLVMDFFMIYTLPSVLVNIQLKNKKLMLVSEEELLHICVHTSFNFYDVFDLLLLSHSMEIVFYFYILSLSLSFSLWCLVCSPMLQDNLRTCMW